MFKETNVQHHDVAQDEKGTISRIAAYIVDARGKHVSERARQSALKRIFDLMAAAVAGATEPGAVAVQNTAAKLIGAGDVPIWFTGAGGSPVAAAWANSVAASTLDIDDGHRLARGHPGAAVIPTAFAIAQEMNAGLESLIAAIVIGYEVGVTIAAARTAYGSTGTWSAYAVVATAAVLRGTSCDVLEHALAIAGESAPNQLFSSAPPFSLPTPEGSDIKEGIPWSVVTGLAALDLAEAGFTGPRNVLDSALHYRFDDALVLGEAQHICNAYYKLYACCRHIHAPLDAFLDMIEQHGIEVQDIERIAVETYGGALRITNKVAPRSVVDVQYSIPYCLALAAMKGRSAFLPLAPDALGDAQLSRFAGKVSLAMDPLLDAQFPARTLARVTIDSKGKRFTSQVTAPRGEAGDPLTWEALTAKFMAMVPVGTDAVRVAQLLAAIDALRERGEWTLLQASLAEPMLGRG